MKKKNLGIFLICAFVFSGMNFASAQESEAKIEYGDNIIVDSDLDGLTDEGENQLYGTDPKNSDTDQDGILDGAEVINGNDPLDNTSPSIAEVYQANLPKVEIPWSWYVSRASALIGFILLYLSIFFGISIRNPLLKKIILPVHSLNIHSRISLQAFFFAFLHGISLIFDKFISFSWLNVFVPFYPFSENMTKLGIEPFYLAAGVISFYLMLLLIVSSYLRKFIPFWVWRLTHFFNIALWIFTVFHALKLGTDMENVLIRDIFIYANIFLTVLFVVNLIPRLVSFIKSKKRVAQNV